VKPAALLAVDGGGSKVDAALLRRDGSVLGAARVANSEHDGTGGDHHLGIVAAAVAAACRDADADPSRKPVAGLGVYCLAGVDFPADDRRITRWLHEKGMSTDDFLRNDTFAVLRAGTDRTWGVSVVCGYGINCSGVAPDGRVTRFPAVGYGDWGGGMDIGRAGLWYAVRSEDGRGRKTVLETLVPQHFGKRRPQQVLEAMYFGRIPEQRVVELPPLVFGAAIGGDAVARSIVDRQADEVVALAGTAIRRLKMRKLDVDVVVGGGIFRNDDERFFGRIRERLTEVAPLARVSVLTSPPVIGAALIGLDRLAAPRSARVKVRRALTHDRLSTQTLGQH
jgi:N-acetylglucosamine kinase-like BadF-type ATPase